ncbi:unnamed protein product [Acanthoscelides obtectus]|uniref:IRS-type PTB domain-containing protein n=1 Tax=Acanthoscelides obtectus TaxID=200917 RepID=A0A9P0K487_ACAOB|nr:unnamed protein product [Acanthoscelides obtectus]CAK1667414.1 Protein Dok-7 [Acanthoscelides obtectus]
MQWQVKLSSHLNDGPHFLVLVSSAPAKSRLPPGPARLHVQERGFCLTTGVPPRVAGHWLIANLRRYGVVEGRFCFEGGSRCMKGEGLYVLLTDQGEEITSTLKIAATGNLHSSRRRPVSRNMSVMDSPRRAPMSRAGCNLGLDMSETSMMSRADSPYTDMESNYGCGDSMSNDGWGPPPIERCMSCISKLGAMSRSSTATVTVGATPCWEHTCDRHSISSSSDSSSGWSQAVTRPPARPPKPPGSVGAATSTSGSTDSPTKAPSPPSYDNYDVPKIPYPVEPKADELYDTPRKLKECIQAGFGSTGFETVHKPCGCVIRVRQQPEPDRPCVCQRLMSCWTAPEDAATHAIYATVDYTKKTQRPPPAANNSVTMTSAANYANLAPITTVMATTTAPQTVTSTNYENMDFCQTLQLYENSKEVAEKARSVLCTKCGHTQDDYLMMDKPSHQPHPGYIPMSPAVKQRLEKALSNSNPNLGPVLDRSTKPSGSAMLHANVYQRRQLLDHADNLDVRRKRSNSADSSTSRVEPEPEPENSPCHCAHALAVRRSSSVPCKSNRDSSSSNDSGVFELPRRTQICASANQTLPRRSKSSDPLSNLTFQFSKTEIKSASAEAEVPVCPSGSTSSGTSDMSDYIETLSLSSHSSSDAPPPSCTLRPRSGNEYLTMQRLIAPVPEERH